MKNPSDKENDHQLEVISYELRMIRKLLTALVFIIGVALVAAINKEIAILFLIAGISSWILLIIVLSTVNRTKRRRIHLK
jgi:hypothetical protein